MVHLIIMHKDATNGLKIFYASRPDVNVIYWPLQRRLAEGITLLMFLAQSHWKCLLVFDTDEYVMI